MLCYAKELAINRGYDSSPKKHLRSVIVFLDVTVNQVGSQHELLTSVQQEKKAGLENMFLFFTNVSVRVHLSKTLWETS